MDLLKKHYDSNVRICLVQRKAEVELMDAMAAHYRAMQRLNATQSFFSKIRTLVSSVAHAASTMGASLADGVASIGASEISDDIETQRTKFNYEYQRTQTLLQDRVKNFECWSNVSNSAASMQAQIESVKAALLSLSSALLNRQESLRSLRSLVEDARTALARESARTVPDLRHHYWYDERKAKFESDFAWARHLTYLAMQAVEHESQASLDLRRSILEATHPVDLEKAARELQREQATRGINGNRPEQKSIVLSLRSELLNLPDKLATGVPESERNVLAVSALTEMLTHPAHAMFAADGEYLGQALPFHFAPQGPLRYRCAERLWAVNATIQGDLLGATSPNLPLFVLKRNTSSSQWCDGRRPDDAPAMQVGTLKPSVNLFRPGTGRGEPGEAEGYSWSFIDAGINTRRKDFGQEPMTSGDTEELAGRGLYGDYLLLFPWYGFLDQQLDLSHIEDVLLRFDYISVSNGPGQVAQGGSHDDLPTLHVTDFRAPETSSCDVTLAWTPPDFPGLGEVRILRRADAPPDPGFALDPLAEQVECDPFGAECVVPTTTAALREEHYYRAYVIDDLGFLISSSDAVLVGPDPLPDPTQVVVTSEGTNLRVTWNASDESCARTRIYRDDELPVAHTGTAPVYFEDGEEYLDSPTVGRHYYFVQACYGDGEADCNPEGFTTPKMYNFQFQNVSQGSDQCSVTLNWNSTTFTGSAGVRILRRENFDPSSTNAFDPLSTHMSSCSASGVSCTLPMTAIADRKTFRYRIYVMDDTGALVRSSSILNPAPVNITASSLGATSLVGGVSLTWSHNASGACASVRIYRSVNSTVDSTDTLVYQGTATQATDQVYSTMDFPRGRMGGWWYGAFRCYGADFTTNCTATAATSTTGRSNYRESFEVSPYGHTLVPSATPQTSGAEDGTTFVMWTNGPSLYTASSSQHTTSSSAPMALKEVHASVKTTGGAVANVCLKYRTASTWIQIGSCTYVGSTNWTTVSATLPTGVNLPLETQVEINRYTPGSVSLDNIRVIGVMQ